ncbi:MAG: ATP-binding cassette domain-containing protein [Gaiellaceae bacterium]
MSDAIVAQHLAKRYGDVAAVVDVSLRVAEGEIFALLGPNGAGKSTTVRMLASLTRPDGGSALVAGHDVVRERRRVRAAIGYVAQSTGTDAYLSGRENLLVQAGLQGLGRAQARARAAELLRLVDLEQAGDRLLRTYSGGMRRRLEIAMGIVHRPRVLFLDEPTTGLDPEARTRLWGELGRLAAEQGLTILLTTHYLEEADELAGRLAIVSRGRVVVEGAPEALKAGLRGDTVLVELAGDGANAAAEVVRPLASVREASVEGRVLRARVGSGTQALPVILFELERCGLRIDAANLARPSLDDVYLHFTGRSFEQEDRAA